MALAINNLEELLFLYSEERHWSYLELSENPSLTKKVLDSLIHKKGWNYHVLSRNPAIDLQFMLDHPSKNWDLKQFACNPSLDIDKIDNMIDTALMNRNHDWLDKLVQFLPKTSLQSKTICCNKLYAIHHFLNREDYLHYNWSVRNDVKKIFTTGECMNNSILNNPHLLLNKHLGNLLFCVVKYLNNCDRKTIKTVCENYQCIDERYVELFNKSTQDNFMLYHGVNSCISLDYCIEYAHRVHIDNQVENPSIIQSIYKLYHQINHYHGRKIGRKVQLNDLTRNELVHIVHVLKIPYHPVDLSDIILKSPYNGIYYENSVLFTPEQFTELACWKKPLFEFTKNPNFEWELLADWSWKEYYFCFLSSNPFQQHMHYRKAQILYELEAVGICLKWNQLDDQLYDDFDARRFLAKFDKDKVHKTSIKPSKRIRV